MFKFEENLANYCKKRGFDGVICGHIHHAEIKEINGVSYMNDGKDRGEALYYFDTAERVSFIGYQNFQICKRVL